MPGDDRVPDDQPEGLIEAACAGAVFGGQDVGAQAAGGGAAVA
ncbi:hypothetical protein ACIBJF_49700 [Streptomyces sp. NPDC050743]